MSSNAAFRSMAAAFANDKNVNMSIIEAQGHIASLFTRLTMLLNGTNIWESIFLVFKSTLLWFFWSFFFIFLAFFVVFCPFCWVFLCFLVFVLLCLNCLFNPFESIVSMGHWRSMIGWDSWMLTVWFRFGIGDSEGSPWLCFFVRGCVQGECYLWRIERSEGSGERIPARGQYYGSTGTWP